MVLYNNIVTSVIFMDEIKQTGIEIFERALATYRAQDEGAPKALVKATKLAIQCISIPIFSDGLPMDNMDDPAWDDIEFEGWIDNPEDGPEPAMLAQLNQVLLAITSYISPPLPFPLFSSSLLSPLLPIPNTTLLTLYLILRIAHSNKQVSARGKAGNTTGFPFRTTTIISCSGVERKGKAIS